MNSKDINADVRSLKHDLQKDLEQLRQKIQKLEDDFNRLKIVDSSIINRIRQLSDQLASVSEELNFLYSSKLKELEKKIEREHIRAPIEDLFAKPKRQEQMSLPTEQANEIDKADKNDSTDSGSVNNGTDTIGTIDKNNKDGSEYENSRISKSDLPNQTTETIRQIRQTEQTSNTDTVTTNLIGNISNTDSIDKNKMPITGPFVNPLELVRQKQMYLQEQKKQEQLQQYIEQRIKILKEVLKNIRSELYVLREMFDTIVAKEKILLTERSQLYKIALETKQKLIQLEKESSGQDILEQLKQKLEAIEKQNAQISVFANDTDSKQTDTNTNDLIGNTRLTKQASKIDTDTRTLDSKQESEDLVIGNNDTKNTFDDLYSYAKRFTENIDTLDTDVIVTDNEDSLTD